VRVEVRKLRPQDADAIVLPPDQAARLAIVPWRESLRGMVGQRNAWTLLLGERVICIAGIVTIWSGRGLCWCYFADQIPKLAWPSLHRAVARHIAAAGYRRLEAEVRCGFEPGRRWCEMLGFQPDGLAEAYFPDGGACERYVRLA
jgi:hypothetical protein